MLERFLNRSSVSRRDFMKTVTALTAMMGLPVSMVPKVAEAAESEDSRLPVIWLHFQECTGCTTSILRSSHPSTADLLLDIISLEYHETLMAGSGAQAENALHNAIGANKGKYVLVCEGAVPLKDDGIYCKIGGKAAKDLLEEVAASASHVITIGTCATLGGVQAADPNPTGAVSCASLVADKPTICLPGCPPNPYNLTATILYILTMGKLPDLDKLNRPVFAYGRKLHDHCERRPHFDAGRFAKAFGDEGHSLGYCLYELGCKGPATYANCSTMRFNDSLVWPVSIGHPCVGCTEHLIFNTTIAQQVPIYDPTSPDWYPPASPDALGKPAGVISAVAVGLAAGAAIGYAAGKGSDLPQDNKDKEKK